MTDGPEWLSIMGGLSIGFFVGFVLFLLLFFLYLRRVRTRITDLKNEIDLKTKELETKKSPDKELFIPFGSLSSKSIILSINAKGELTRMNEAAEELFGYKADELIGKSVLGTLFPMPEADDVPGGLIARIFANPRLYVEYDTQNIKKDGEKIWLSWTNRVSCNSSGEPSELHAVGFDITRRKRLESDLKCLSSEDSVLQVLNRQCFLETGSIEMARANRFHRKLTCLVLELSLFQSPSSQEKAGSFSDAALLDIITLCRQNMRASDVIGRIGDVQFALLMPETSVQEALAFADKLKKLIYEKNLSTGRESFMQISFSAAEKKARDKVFDTVLSAALRDLKQKDII